MISAEEIKVARKAGKVIIDFVTPGFLSGTYYAMIESQNSFMVVAACASTFRPVEELLRNFPFASTAESRAEALAGAREYFFELFRERYK